MEREVKAYNSYKNLSYIDGNLPENVKHDLKYRYYHSSYAVVDEHPFFVGIDHLIDKIQVQQSRRIHSGDYD